MTQIPVEKNNALTRFMRQVADTNAAAGLPAGRSAGGPANVDPPTRVRSGAMRTPIPVKPLTSEEKAELDRRAKALGIMPKDELDELAESEEEEEEKELLEAKRSTIPIPGTLRKSQQPSFYGPPIPSSVTQSQLPDFTQVQRFDLTTNTIYVDGMSFPIPPEDVIAMKSYAVQIVLDHVVAQLAKALVEFDIPSTIATGVVERPQESTDDGKEKVSEMREGLPDSGIQPEPDQEARLGVSNVSPATSEGLPAVGEGPGDSTSE